jgi:hypothetical protein
MKKKFLVLAGAGVAALGLSQAAQAALIPTTTSSTSSWLGTPVYKTGPAPTTGNGGTTQDNDSWGGNANGLNGFGALAMTFEVSQAGTLGAVQLSMAGSPQLFNVELYDMGSASTYAYSTAGGNVGITQINGLGEEPSNTAEIVTPSNTYDDVSDPDLLAAGDQAQYNGIASGNNLWVLGFTGADATVSLVPGELYLLSLDPTANADGTWWQRGGLSTGDTGEGLNADGSQGMQNFEGKGVSGGIREFDLAVTVPEPATFGLIGLASLGLLKRRRHQA